MVKNDTCFSSANADGGVYFAPELMVKIKKGNLYIEYNHGRYGYKKYCFRFQYSDFELIGYDAAEHSGPVVNSEVSINYLTNKKIQKLNTNENADSGEEKFKETVSRIPSTPLLKLSGVRDFDQLRLPGE